MFCVLKKKKTDRADLFVPSILLWSGRFKWTCDHLHPPTFNLLKAFPFNLAVHFTSNSSYRERAMSVSAPHKRNRRVAATRLLSRDRPGVSSLNRWTPTKPAPCGSAFIEGIMIFGWGYDAEDHMKLGIGHMRLVEIYGVTRFNVPTTAF